VAEVEPQGGLAPGAHALSAAAVGVAVHPPAAHPESARDIAYPDEPVGWPAQFGRDSVRDRFDVLIVERHRVNDG
jgi:hypothetical protein